ncbi:hypothetical protein SORBI_3001G305550 [Sorghum bicolor]|uniref:Uncharacterized protein n=1 Tax=Sorghum bicolor TaxID=4558 RepID=A0A1Z5S8D1_SORBI|nr:hypothetical protein SORBI_3001G305550 [Sorghum bicolor]
MQTAGGHQGSLPSPLASRAQRVTTPYLNLVLLLHSTFHFRLDATCTCSLRILEISSITFAVQLINLCILKSPERTAGSSGVVWMDGAGASHASASSYCLDGWLRGKPC